MIPLRTRRSLRLRVRFTILALEDWLHRFSSRRERGKCRPSRSISLSKRKLHVTLTTPKRGDTCCKTFTRAEIEQGPKITERQLANPRNWAERREVADFPEFVNNKEQVPAKQEARLFISEFESHTRKLFEEQRSR